MGGARVGPRHRGRCATLIPVSSPTSRRVLASRPPELVVYDEPSRCPYLDGHTARLPLRLPLRPLTRAELDVRLEQGDRRQGLLLYRTACPSCAACEPIRIPVADMRWGWTLRRVFRRGERVVRTELGPLQASPEKLALYNKHKRGRDLLGGERELEMDGYRPFLGESCCDSFEMRYFHDGRLVGVAIVDRGAASLSAVYTFFDPDLAHLSLGTYSILKQVDLCRRWGLPHLYLGLYIADCPTMVYKARFLPHERLLDGAWRVVEQAPAAPPGG